MKITDKNISRKENISVDFFFNLAKDRCGLELINDQVGFGRLITEQNLHRPGLALAGFMDLFTFNRIQIFGNTEMRYLTKLDGDKREEILEKFLDYNLPCVIITNGNKPTEDFIRIANDKHVAIFGTQLETTKLAYFVSDMLEDQFAPRISIHGSFVDVYGVGMLFVGKSGIGKSEVALDLVERGHRLVADDVVIFTKKGEGILIGAGTELTGHFMELRGVGIIDVKNTFGIRSIRFQKRLEVVIDLELWDEKSHYTRTGLDDKTVDIQGVHIPYVKLPIIPGKNITVIAEVIALNYLLKHYGYDAAKVFQERLTKKLQSKLDENSRSVDYFEHDFE